MVDTRDAWRLIIGTTRLSPANDEKTFSIYPLGEMEAPGLAARPENSGR